MLVRGDGLKNLGELRVGVKGDCPMKLLLNSKFIKISLSCLIFLLAVILSGCDRYIETIIPEDSTAQEHSPEYELLQNANSEIILEFLTQPAENTVRIIVVPDWGEQRNIYVKERTQIEHIYRLLKETDVIRIEEYPGHTDHPARGSHFTIILEYQNGDIDEFRTAENPEFVLRLLDTRGTIGDRGFIMGVNERLWIYIFDLDANEYGFGRDTFVQSA